MHECFNGVCAISQYCIMLVYLEIPFKNIFLKDPPRSTKLILDFMTCIKVTQCTFLHENAIRGMVVENLTEPSYLLKCETVRIKVYLIKLGGYSE